MLFIASYITMLVANITTNIFISLTSHVWGLGPSYMVCSHMWFPLDKKCLPLESIPRTFCKRRKKNRKRIHVVTNIKYSPITWLGCKLVIGLVLIKNPRLNKVALMFAHNNLPFLKHETVVVTRLLTPHSNKLSFTLGHIDFKHSPNLWVKIIGWKFSRESMRVTPLFSSTFDER